MVLRVRLAWLLVPTLHPVLCLTSRYPQDARTELDAWCLCDSMQGRTDTLPEAVLVELYLVELQPAQL